MLDSRHGPTRAALVSQLLRLLTGVLGSQHAGALQLLRRHSRGREVRARARVCVCVCVCVRVCVCVYVYVWVVGVRGSACQSQGRAAGRGRRGQRAGRPAHRCSTVAAAGLGGVEAPQGCERLETRVHGTAWWHALSPCAPHSCT